MLQKIRFQVQVLKPCKSVQETSKKVLYFKARQLASIEVYKAAETRNSTASLIDTLSVEVYEKQIFSSIFQYYCASVKQNFVNANCDQRQNLP